MTEPRTLCERCRAIELLVLDVDGCRRLQDHGLVCLARLPRLERLSLNHCGRLIGSGLADLADPPRLRVLHLRGTSAK